MVSFRQGMWRRSSALLAMFALLAGSVNAQVLARPGWAGSGVTLEPWWAHGVFYRIEVARFQDSDGDGVGDLGGVAERMDYLQGLGVDALVLDGLQAQRGEGEQATEAFAEVVRAATLRHLRVIVELKAADAPSMEAARAWLTQGAAGIYLELRESGRADVPAAALAGLRRMTDGFAGGRILLAGRSDALAAAGGSVAQLVVGDALDAASGVAGLRTQIERQLGAAAAPVGRRRSLAARPVMVLRSGSSVGAAAGNAARDERASMLLVLGSRGAAMLEAGDELGLARRPDGGAPLMQWTPSNVTPKPVAEVKPEAAAPEPVYKAYRPYVPSLPHDLFPVPKSPEVVFSDAAVPVPVAMLPGFTTGKLPAGATAANGAAANVVAEEADKDSVLKLTRRLLQLRQDHSSLRSGTERFFERDALGALVWVRGVPAGTRTSGAVVAVANLTGAPLYVSLTDAVPGRGASAPVRNLIEGGGQELGHIRVQAFGVFLGELGR